MSLDTKQLRRWPQVEEFFDLETDTDPGIFRRRLALIVEPLRALDYVQSEVGVEALVDAVLTLILEGPEEARRAESALCAAVLGQVAKYYWFDGRFAAATVSFSLLEQFLPEAQWGDDVLSVYASLKLRLGIRPSATWRCLSEGEDKRIFGQRLAYLSGELSSSPGLPADPEACTSFFELLCLAQQLNDPAIVLQNTHIKAARFSNVYYRLLSYLYLVSVTDRFSRRLQTPKNIQRQSLVLSELSNPLFHLYQFARGVEKLVSESPTDKDFLASVANIEAQSARVLEPEAVLFAWLTIARVSRLRGFGFIAEQYAEKYKCLSRHLSQGVTDDPLHRFTEHRLPLQRKGVRERLKMVQIFDVSRKLLFGSQQKEQSLQTLVRLLSKERAHNLVKARGFMQKVAQLGAGIEGLIPEPLQAVFAEAYDQPNPMPGPALQKILGEAFAEWPFASFEENPIASGSLGQVHLGSLPSGERVAVKVKFEGVEAGLRRDFRAAKSLAWIIESLTPHRDVGGMMQGWGDMLLDECDYKREAQFQERAARIFASDETIRVPAVFHSLSGDSVIVQEFIEAETFDQFMSHASQEAINKAAERIMISLLKLLAHGIFRYDIHQGNYLFGEDTLVLVDFGASSDAFLHHHKFPLVIDAVRRDDRNAFERYVVEAGFFELANIAGDDAFYERWRFYLQPFLVDKPFEFTPEFAKQVVNMQLNQDNPLNKGKFPSSPEQANVRFYWSLYGLLGRMRAKSRWYSFIEEYLAAEKQQASAKLA